MQTASDPGTLQGLWGAVLLPKISDSSGSRLDKQIAWRIQCNTSWEMFSNIGATFLQMKRCSVKEKWIIFLSCITRGPHLGCEEVEIGKRDAHQLEYSLYKKDEKPTWCASNQASRSLPWSAPCGQSRPGRCRLRKNILDVWTHFIKPPHCGNSRQIGWV